MSDFVINGAILHIFDYSSGLSVYSEATMNLEDKTVERYVRRQVKKIQNDMRLQKGYFEEESTFLKSLLKFERNENSFTEFTVTVTNQFVERLKQVSANSYDILYVSYLEDEIPYIAMIFLENQQAYTHTTTQVGNSFVNSVILQNSVLPSLTKKLNSFVSINLLQNEIQFADEIDWSDTEEGVMQNLILQCTCEKSANEVLQDVEMIVDEIAEVCDENPTLLLSKYKNYVQETIAEEKPISTDELALHVFNDTEEMQNTFISKSVEHELPKEIDLPKKVPAVKLKQQKIKTDTGIEISFPTAYSENSDFIEFIRHDDGTISIEIRNIAKITNK